MTLDFQIAFNIAVGIVGVLGGWILNTMWNAIKDMQTADHNLTEKVAAIEVLVAGQYLRRDEYRGDLKSMNETLLRIEGKLDTKADKK